MGTMECAVPNLVRKAYLNFQNTRKVGQATKTQEFADLLIMQKRENLKTPKGSWVPCAGCGKLFQKRQYNCQFCRESCRDFFWNTVNTFY